MKNEDQSRPNPNVSATDSPYTVLIADDEPIVREMLADKIRHAGLAVLLASNGREALALACSHLPQVILLDWVMPEPDGLAVCRWLKNNQATTSIPVILLTAHGQNADREAGLRAGADLMLVKPISLRLLLDHIWALSEPAKQVA